MEEQNYSPLSIDEFKSLSDKLTEVKDYLPEHYLSEFWRLCNLIRGERAPQPCSCRTSAGLWGNCVQTLRNFVNERS